MNSQGLAQAVGETLLGDGQIAGSTALVASGHAQLGPDSIQHALTLGVRQRACRGDVEPQFDLGGGSVGVLPAGSTGRGGRHLDLGARNAHCIGDEDRVVGHIGDGATSYAAVR